jgi:3-oxoacyl-[acyl-carrier protein] reductase
MDLGLKGKVALVTGAGSQIGFGQAIALTLAREGCDIIATDMNIEGAKKTAASVEALGRKAIALKADVASITEVKDMVKAALEQFGRIDILVNDAGVGNIPKPFAEMAETDWDLLINVNFRGVLNCTKAVLPQMLERKSGKIVNVSAVGGLMSTPGIAVYSAAKAGVISFTKSLGAEVAASGINVNSVAPGLAKTNFGGGGGGGSSEFFERVSKNIPLGRITVPQDIANAVAFLASDVSSDIVGQTFNVSGSA